MARSPVLRFRWPIALVWLVAAGALLPLAPGVEDRPEVSARILGSESAETERILAQSFESPFARSAILVVSGVPAATMIAVFVAFTLGELVLLKMLGFALAAAVLFDATVIRMAIGPALLRLAGCWNWWPGR